MNLKYINDQISENIVPTLVCAVAAPVVVSVTPLYATTALATYAALHGAYHAINTLSDASIKSVAQALTEGFAVAAVDFAVASAMVKLIPSEKVSYAATEIYNNVPSVSALKEVAVNGYNGLTTTVGGMVATFYASLLGANATKIEQNKSVANEYQYNYSSILNASDVSINSSAVEEFMRNLDDNSIDEIDGNASLPNAFGANHSSNLNASDVSTNSSVEQENDAVEEFMSNLDDNSIDEIGGNVSLTNGSGANYSSTLNPSDNSEIDFLRQRTDSLEGDLDRTSGSAKSNEQEMGSLRELATLYKKLASLTEKDDPELSETYFNLHKLNESRVADPVNGAESFDNSTGILMGDACSTQDTYYQSNETQGYSMGTKDIQISYIGNVSLDSH